MPRCLQQQLGVHQIHFLIERALQQSGGEHGRENLRFLLGNFAAIQQRGTIASRPVSMPASSMPRR